MRPSLSLVVPVFNEQDRFAEHADELPGHVRRYTRRLVGAWRLPLPAGTSIVCVAGKASGGDRG